MKKLVYLTLALACLFLCTSCNDSVNDNSGFSVSLEPSVSKYLGQTSIIDMTSDTNINSYYWEYSYQRFSPDGTSSTNFEWKSFYPQEERTRDTGKGFKPITDIPRTLDKYLFSIRGYSDPGMNTLIWEGTASQAVKLVGRTVHVVPICLECVGEGNLYLDISAHPVVGELDEESRIEIAMDFEVKHDYFILTYDSFTSMVPTLNKDDAIINKKSPTLKTYKLDPIYSTETNQYIYKNEEPLVENMPSGAYIVSIEQFTWDYNDEVYKTIPTRKQVFFLGVFPESDNWISGELDAFISTESEVVYHYYESPENLENIIQVGSPVINGNYTVYTYEPVLKDASLAHTINWNINGVAIENSLLAPISYAEESYLKSLYRDDWIYYIDVKSYAKAENNQIKIYRYNDDELQYSLTCLINSEMQEEGESFTISI